MRRHPALLLCSAILLVASLAALPTRESGERRGASHREVGRRPAAPGVVDRPAGREEALRRFREPLARPDGLAGGAPSRDALVRRFVGALERADTAALRAMLVTKAEFAYLYYPTTPQSLPPYDLDPALMWFLLSNRGTQGLSRALEEVGGRPYALAGHACDPDASLEGDNRVWGPCVLRRVRAPGDTVEERLFGLILERDGRFKFLSYSNPLD